ncbi:DNA adenine methylase [Rhizobium sp. AU243]|uniref:DNA adenine methylase n=1 Tax=Rhizobium sp. AU243 TaxID=2303425 RepID=UPI00148592D8|nr:DNA adenine methylase [Rhizobium sp. AU243]
MIYSIKPIPEIIGTFPATRYYGSKRKLLHWIYDCVKSFEFETVLDAFGGSGTVSQLFRAMRKEVTYSDAFQFNVDIARSTLTGEELIGKEQVEQFLATVSPIEGTVARNFQAIFFLDDENRWIDGFMETLRSSDFSTPERAMLKTLLYQACLKKRPFNLFHRANLSIRTNKNVVRSFGNFTTWEKAFPEHILQTYDELSSYRPDRLRSATILPCGDICAVAPGYDLVYLDPPYVSTSERANRDNYWLRYHFLEGLAQYDDWERGIIKDSKVRKFIEPPHFSTWSSRKTFKENLFDLIDTHKRSIVVLSYVKEAYPDDATIQAFFESKFAKVSIHSTEHHHALGLAKKRELLFIGVPS